MRALRQGARPVRIRVFNRLWRCKEDGPKHGFSAPAATTALSVVPSPLPPAASTGTLPAIGRTGLKHGNVLGVLECPPACSRFGGRGLSAFVLAGDPFLMDIAYGLS